MAEAYGKLTGRPGVCIVTRGPGATHASVGVHTAFQDSTPLFLLVGQVARRQLGREAFQEVDYRADVRPAGEVGRADRPGRADPRARRARVPRRRRRAGRAPSCSRCPRTCSPRTADVADAAPVPARAAEPGRATTSRGSASCSHGAERPLVVVGGQPLERGGARRRSPPGARRASSRSRRRGAARTTSTTRSPVYAGHLRLGPDPRLAARVARRRRAARRSARGSATSRPGATRSSTCRRRGSALVHVHPDPDELGRVYEPELAIVSRARAVRRRAAPLGPLVDGRRWREGPPQAHADYLDEPPPRPERRAASTSATVMALLRGAAARRRDRSRTAPATSRSGRTASTSSARYGTQLAPTSGAMGYGVPAAVAAKLVHPERTVVCFAGDGDFLMTRPGARDRGPVRRPGRRARRRQRHVRDDPHAPGASLPRPRQRHRPRQPRLRRARARVRRLTASGSSGPRTSRRRSSARSLRDRPAVLHLLVDPRRSRRARRSPRSGSRRSRSQGVGRRRHGRTKMEALDATR